MTEAYDREMTEAQALEPVGDRCECCGEVVACYNTTVLGTAMCDDCAREEEDEHVDEDTWRGDR